jgi:citrate synthase
LIFVNPTIVNVDYDASVTSRMTADDAARRLGVKRETLYAYVSRGILTSRRAAGGRTSTFDPDEIEQLARRGRPRRATRGPVVDVTVHSAITRLERAALTFRNHDAVTLAAGTSFEQVADLLWSGRPGPFERWPAPEPSPAVDLECGTVLDRVRAAAALAALDAPETLRRPEPGMLVAGARHAMAAMTAAVGRCRHDRTPRLHLGGDAPRSLRDTTAARLAVRLSPRRPGPELVAALNATLVLLADHELAVSTLAARVAASARADAFGVIGAGLGPLSGELHGTASRGVRALLDDAQRTGATTALRRATGSALRLGFGHRLYPDGDPRATALLARVRALPAPARLLGTVEDVAAAGRERFDEQPNVDFAIAALGHVAGLPADAGDALFAIGRTAGWIAHALEELDEPPLRYRTRAVPRRDQ